MANFVHSEIAIAQVDKLLQEAVLKNVYKTVKLMCAKCEQLLDNGASQVVNYPTNEQRKNVQVVNCLFTFYVGIEKVVEKSEILKEIENLMKSAIDPLISSISDAVEAIILTIHNEDWQDKCSSSPYLKELQVIFLVFFVCLQFVYICLFFRLLSTE